MFKNSQWNIIQQILPKRIFLSDMCRERGTIMKMFRKFVLLSCLTSEDDACFQCVIKTYVTACFLPMEKRADFFFIMRNHTLARVSYLENRQFPCYILCIGNLLCYKFLSLEVVAYININKDWTMNYCHIYRRFNILVDLFISYFLLNTDDLTIN